LYIITDGNNVIPFEITVSDVGDNSISLAKGSSYRKMAVIEQRDPLWSKNLAIQKDG